MVSTVCLGWVVEGVSLSFEAATVHQQGVIVGVACTPWLVGVPAHLMLLRIKPLVGTCMIMMVWPSICQMQGVGWFGPLGSVLPLGCWKVTCLLVIIVYKLGAVHFPIGKQYLETEH
eukprot:GHRR01025490.1.p1 GENE.GHRR01025490.1~~GHRR01025490.1.p1  ORF type:complete len:117 (+),score=5.52 GHRR01025490.1:274-624(+)